MLLPLIPAKAMPVGTLLYRSSGGNKMYGLNSDDLIVAEKGKLSHIYSGHAAIYVGKENGIDYIVEMQPKGAIKVPAKYFINEAAGEELVAAKLPAKASALQRATAVSIAKNLASRSLSYDFDFKKQKGPGDGEWTCVGLTEKVYESSDISNPTNLNSLEYDKDYYAVDITPDGYDNDSLYNSSGDCFSESLEYSKIAPKKNMLIPAPEILGYDVGLEHDGDRYIFLPYTQALQDSLRDVDVDITLSSSFPEPDIRGDSPILGLVLKWSLINNPISAVKRVWRGIESGLAFIKDKAFLGNELVIEKKLINSTEEKTLGSKPVSPPSAKTAAKTSTSKISKTAVSKAASISAKTSLSKTAAVTKSSDNKIISAASSSSPVSDVKVKQNAATIVSSPRTSSRTSVKSPVETVKTGSSTQPIVIVVSTTPVVIEERRLGNEDEPEPVPETEEEPEKQIALIAKIYSNGSDDWLEIVNTSDKDLDLAEAGYRLEKAKTGSDPTLVMRIGDENDGIYPGGTVVKSHESYLIVNDDSSEEMLAKADAIAIKDSFTWSEDAYTLYLGTASISSDNDIDIIDKLGYGEAIYFETSPAPALKKGYALERRASANSTLESMSVGGGEEFWPRLFDSNDNSSDFILIPFDGSLIEEENTGSDDVPQEHQENTNLFIPPNGLDSEGLMSLWHFDECYGEAAFNELQISGQEAVDFKRPDDWTVGRWGCGASIKNDSAATKAIFKQPLDINQFTLNFYYRNRDSSVGFVVSFYNSAENGRSASLEFTPYYTSIHGFPGPSGRIDDIKWPNDNQWHQVSVVVDREKLYWALYIDAKEVYRYEYSGIIPTFEYMDIKGIMGNSTDFDELSFWNRSLPISELKTINILNQPFNPYTWPSTQEEAELIHYWNFDENAGSSANDTISSEKMAVSPDQWNMEGASSSALTIGNKVETAFEKSYVNDLSLSFWWRNISSENEGRLELSLKENDNTILSFRPTPYNSSFGFNTCGGVFIQYPGFYIPNDKQWHHFALTYDSYRYLFKFYVDGVEKYVKECIKLGDGRFINALKINPENYPSAVDEIKIWNGVLFPQQVLSEFESLKH